MTTRRDELAAENERLRLELENQKLREQLAEQQAERDATSRQAQQARQAQDLFRSAQQKIQQGREAARACEDYYGYNKNNAGSHAIAAGEQLMREASELGHQGAQQYLGSGQPSASRSDDCTLM